MITIHNNMKIYHNHLQVLCVRCVKTGKFLKHAQAKRVLFMEWSLLRKEWLKTVVVLFSCVSMNVLTVGYTVFWSI